MDPVSIAASLVALAGAAIGTSKLAIRVGERLSKARRRFNDVAQSLANFSAVLKTLARVVTNAADLLDSDGLQDTFSLLEECKQLVEEIRNLFDGLNRSSLGMVDRLKWVYKETSLEYPQGRLELAKNDLSLIIEVLNLALNIKNHREIQDTKRRNEMLEQYETAKTVLTLRQMAAGQGSLLEAMPKPVDDSNQALSAICDVPKSRLAVLSEFQALEVADTPSQYLELDAAGTIKDLVERWTSIGHAANDLVDSVPEFTHIPMQDDKPAGSKGQSRDSESNTRKQKKRKWEIDGATSDEASRVFTRKAKDMETASSTATVGSSRRPSIEDAGDTFDGVDSPPASIHTILEERACDDF